MVICGQVDGEGDYEQDHGHGDEQDGDHPERGPQGIPTPVWEPHFALVASDPMLG